MSGMQSGATATFDIQCFEIRRHVTYMCIKSHAFRPSASQKHKLQARSSRCMSHPTPRTPRAMESDTCPALET